MKRISELLPPGVQYYSNRQDYLTRTGKQAPPYDPSRPPRLWTGPNLDGSYPAYKSIAGPPTNALVPRDAIPPVAALKSSPLMQAFLGPQDLAGGVNIPGPTNWVDWNAWMLTRASSAVTVTITLFGGDRSQAIGKDALFTTTEAAAVAKEIGGTAVEATDWNGQKATYNYPEGEKRRVWSIQLPGMLLAMSNAWRGRTEGAGHGIGSPGHWNVADGGATWISEAADLGDRATGDVPVPSVDLAPDEEVAMVNIGGFPVLVVRKKNEAVPAIPPVTGGGLTAAQSDMLQQVFAGVKLLVERSGG